ncbi:hypothetical protein BI308_05970 [Roseofilum reptotaenium AO1-A]|uniref:Uncharacterized protein n=1 Tax=Roseofilum reptotaenium AO1-A TaxID=1925591 RepID=A0A1L9QUS7_9CYAN|nr:hypothetical protein BI308_05970 [Roseofilum reptotaenium AO1-A]
MTALGNLGKPLPGLVLPIAPELSIRFRYLAILYSPLNLAFASIPILITAPTHFTKFITVWVNGVLSQAQMQYD